MIRDDWCDQFIDELIKIRPHANHRFAKTLALHLYSTEHPRTAAREYHKRQEPQSPAMLTSKRRSK